MANKKCTNVQLGIQTGTTNTLYFTWTWNGYIPKNHSTWSKNHTTDHFVYQIQHTTGDGTWFWDVNGSSLANNVRNVTFTIPDNAKRVRFRIKPIAKTHKVNDKDTAYYTSAYTDWNEYKVVADKTPEVPVTPTVSINGTTLTMELDSYDKNTNSIQFSIVKNDATTYGKYIVDIKKNHVSLSVAVENGAEYKVRARGGHKTLARVAVSQSKGTTVNPEDYYVFSGWSNYSANVSSAPDAPAWTSYYAKTSTEVQLNWQSTKGSTSYEVQYTTQYRYFDSSGNVSSMTVNNTNAAVTGLESGTEYFFRVRGNNESGTSGWSEIISIVVGAVPDAPTTWANIYTSTTDKLPVLYWTHNSEDGSPETKAELYITINGAYIGARYDDTSKEKDQVCSYSLALLGSNFQNDTKIEFKIRTMGILKRNADGTEAWSPWSTVRTIQLYQTPTLSATVSGLDENQKLASYPLILTYNAGPVTQNPISWHHEIIACATYETIDETGQSRTVMKNEVIWSKSCSASERSTSLTIDPTLTILENGEEYIVKTVVGMNTGLSTSHEQFFRVSMLETPIDIEAVINYDTQTYTASIEVAVYDRIQDNELDIITDENDNPIYANGGKLLDDALVSIYRREFDGSFVPIVKNAMNRENNTFVDPHPALDYARYRVVANLTGNGSFDFYDLPAYPIQEKAIIIQWSEQWQNYIGADDLVLASPAWSGSLVRLPYNIDISDDFSNDVNLQKYIGRKRPVSYYGTQQEHTATWSVDIPKDDVETLYAIRRLADYFGNCYVREPSGTGYWAQIKVSYSQTHNELVIPISFSITRVEGGA